MNFRPFNIQKTIRGRCDVRTMTLRVATVFFILRRLIHLHQGWISRCPSLNGKLLLGYHLADDSNIMSLFYQRLESLEESTGYCIEPNDSLQALFDFLENIPDWKDYLGAVSFGVKPLLADLVEYHLLSTDLVLDTKTALIFKQLRELTSPHIRDGIKLLNRESNQTKFFCEPLHQTCDQLRSQLSEIRSDFLGSKLIEFPVEIPPLVFSPLQIVERSSLQSHFPESMRLTQVVESADLLAQYDEISVESAKKTLHTLLNDELELAEILAETSHQSSDLAVACHQDLARGIWDRLRHVQVLETMIENLGGRWGDFSVNLQRSTQLLTLPVHDRLDSIANEMNHRLYQFQEPLFALLSDHFSMHPEYIFDHFKVDDQYLAKTCLHWATVPATTVLL
jgi:hypothetical protein